MVEHRQSVRADHLEDLRGAVGGPVVHDDHVAVLGPARLQEVEHGAADDPLLIEGGHDEHEQLRVEAAQRHLGPAECQGEEQVAEPHDDQGQGQKTNITDAVLPSPTVGRGRLMARSTGCGEPAAEHTRRYARARTPRHD